MERGLECRSVGLCRKDRDGSLQTVLVGVDAVFPAGTVSLVTGPTGAGKSSLLHILGCLLRPTEGEVLADGEAVSRWISAHRNLWRRRVGIVFQNPQLMADLTVLENVILPLIPRGPSIPEVRARGIKELAKLGIDQLAGKETAALSGGERQRASIARALISRPDFVLADEPTSHQDNHSADMIMGSLRRAAGRDSAVIVAAHDPRVVNADFADRRWCLEGGRLRAMR